MKKIKSTFFVWFLVTFSVSAQWSTTNPVYFNAGNVGIGTTSPGMWFTGKVLEIADSRPVLKLRSNASTLSTVVFTNDAVNVGTHLGEFHINHQFNSTSPDQSLLRFYSYPGGEILALQSNGNVGIGTTTPTAKLHISGVPRNTLRVYADGNTTNYLSIWQGSGGAGIDPINTGLLYLGYDQSTNVIVGNAGGSLGIGTTSPVGKLDINSSGGQLRLSGGTVAGGVWTNNTDILYLADWNTGSKGIIVNMTSGNVGIGTTSPNQKLTVNGTIYGKEVKVDLNVPGPDYVFEKNYKLPTLADLENFINQHMHLPEVPSAKEMETNGINVSEMNMLLLKKVEELTLHLIEMKKQMDAQEKRIEELTKK